MLALFTIFMAMAAALLLLIAWARGGRLGSDRRVEGDDPLCAKCGYCVRGLEGTICPECGGDLRVVGVLMPGAAVPMSRGKRLLIWTLAAPLPAFLLFGILSPIIIPQWIKTTQRRVIFSQSTFCNVTITAEAHGKRLVFGQPDTRTTAAVPEVLFLSHDQAHMDIQLPAKTYRFNARNGTVVSGKFDPKAIETWLNDAGFTDPRVAERATDIASAVDEMGTPAGNGFTYFGGNGFSRTGDGVAHPTFTFSFPQPNELTTISGIGLIVLFWAAGLPFVSRRKPRRVHFASQPAAQNPSAVHAA